MDRSEWQGVYEDCFPRVFRALVAIGARPDEAEDALHDAFVLALRQREPIVRPEGWLFVVASGPAHLGVRTDNSRLRRA